MQDRLSEAVIALQVKALPGGGLVRRSFTLRVPLWVVVSSSSLEWEEAKSRER